MKDFRSTSRNEYLSHGRTYTIGHLHQRYNRWSDVSTGSGSHREVVLDEPAYGEIERTLEWCVTKGAKFFEILID